MLSSFVMGGKAWGFFWKSVNKNHKAHIENSKSID